MRRQNDFVSQLSTIGTGYLNDNIAQKLILDVGL